MSRTVHQGQHGAWKDPCDNCDGLGEVGAMTCELCGGPGCYFEPDETGNDLNSYQVAAARTLTPDAELAILALGLCGESGELVDHLKKHLGHGHDLDRDYVEKEIGDVLWYLAALSTKLGISLQSAADKNIEKLRRRYPDGFSHEASRNRDDDEVGNDAPER